MPSASLFTARLLTICPRSLVLEQTTSWGIVHAAPTHHQQNGINRPSSASPADQHDDLLSVTAPNSTNVLSICCPRHVRFCRQTSTFFSYGLQPNQRCHIEMLSPQLGAWRSKCTQANFRERCPHANGVQTSTSTCVFGLTLACVHALLLRPKWLTHTRPAV